MRVFGVLGLLAPAAVLLMINGLPPPVERWLGPEFATRSANALPVMVGATLMALGCWFYLRLRLVPLLGVAERLADGELHIRAPYRHSGPEGRLSRALNEISEVIASSHDAATTDRLTGVGNRQALVTNLINEVERATRYGRPLSVAFVDIDHFKAVNDSHGHHVGDIVLRGVAETLRNHLRTADMIGRYGGEEFMLVLPETDVDEAAQLAENLRQLVLRRRFNLEGVQDLSVTVSIGIAGGAGKNLRVDALVRDADAAMYSAKSLGRNQTYVFSEPAEDARIPRAPISADGRAHAHAIGRAARDAAEQSLLSILAPLANHRGQPSMLIASIVVAMARQLDLPDVEIERIRVAALLHDIGKIAVPVEVLEKPSALTTVEWQSVVQHPRIGQVILEQASALKEAVPIILHHHERYGGHGYPHGLRGADIPLGARIVAIADAYDAMISERPYKRAMDHEHAIRELRHHAGTQFDPQLVVLFCDMFATYRPIPDPALLQGMGGTPTPAARTRRRSTRGSSSASAAG